MALPAEWTSVPATKRWDGKSGVASDSADVDQFVSPFSASSWGFAAPSKQDLAAYTAALVAATTRYHGNTCPPKPQMITRITVGGGPGSLLAYNCGILINLATAVHHGVGYTFGFRDPSVHAATNPNDQAMFAAMLTSVRFPS